MQIHVRKNPLKKLSEWVAQVESGLVVVATFSTLFFSNSVIMHLGWAIFQEPHHLDGITDLGGDTALQGMAGSLLIW